VIKNKIFHNFLKFCNYNNKLFNKEYNRTYIDNTYDEILDLCRNNSSDLDLLNFLNEAYFFRQNDAFHIDFYRLRNEYIFYVLRTYIEREIV